MRRLSAPLAILSLLATVVVLTPAPSAAAACASSSSKQIAGTVAGEDGRFVSAQVGIELFDAQQHKIRMDGCRMSESGYSVNAHTNLKSSCCYLLPATGATGPTYQGVTLSKAWHVSGLPANAATAWIEVYPKKCCVPAGVTNTDDARYGRALRRPISLPATGVDVELPLRCGLTGGGVTGGTGAIKGRVFDNGKVVASSRVGAWSQETDDGNKILGWSLDGAASGSFNVEPLAPGRYSIIATANGLSKQKFDVDVAACQTTTVDIAVRGAVPPPPGPIDRPVPGDWNGDGADEPGTFRPGGAWNLRSGIGPADTTLRSFTYGVAAGDTPVVGDWDGDGDDDVAIFRKGGTWYFRSSTTGQTTSTIVYGRSAGDVPVVGDWDGDGTDDIGIFRKGGAWHLRSSATGNTLPVITFGIAAGDRPVVGDWDGNGRDEPGIFRVGGTWHLRSSTGSTATSRPVFTYGIEKQDLPAAGDWTGDTTDSVAIYRRGTWHLRSGTALTGTTIASFRYGS